MLSRVVAQHEEVLCVLLGQLVLRSDDPEARSSGALLGKEAWMVVIVLLL
jgi:hypothetical protein